MLGSFSSGSVGRVNKAHKQCGAHRQRSGLPQGRVHKAGRRKWSKGYRVA